MDARVNGFVPFWGGGQVDAVRHEEGRRPIRHWDHQGTRDEVTFKSQVTRSAVRQQFQKSLINSTRFLYYRRVEVKYTHIHVSHVCVVLTHRSTEW